VFTKIKETVSIASIASEVPSFREIFDLLGMPEVQDLEARYGVEESSRAKY